MSGVDNDIYLWTDGTWCFQDELSQYTCMGDEYNVIPDNSEEWKMLADAIEPSISEIANSHICDMCGSYSVNLVEGICDTPSCIRYREDT